MKTLAVYHKQLGDTLLLQPALAKLAAEDGEAVGVITRPGFADLVRLMPGAAPVRWQHAPRVERLFSYDTGDRSTFSSFWSGARQRTLFAFSEYYRRFYHSWVFHHVRYEEQGQRYRGRYFWDITPGEAPFDLPQLNAPPADWSHESLPRQPFILIHPTSAWQRKCWPADPWREVLAHLRKISSLPVVLTGGTSDWERGLCADVGRDDPEVLNLGGRTSIRQIIAAASQAAMVLTVDGFMSHLALAYRKPCVTLFGPTNANHWHAASEWSEAIFDGDQASSKTKTLDAMPASRVTDAVERWLGTLSGRAPASPLPLPSAGS